MHTAPIFKQSKKDNFKVKVDDRFKTLLSDERFQSVPGKVDKYGRKAKGKDVARKVAQEMKEFYDINEDADENVDEEAAGTDDHKKPAGAKPVQGGNMESRLDYLNRLARGEASDSSDSDGSDDDSDSSSEQSSSDDCDEGEEPETEHGTRRSALDIPDQAEPELSADVSSTRIAIQNCDWENLTAEDIMVVLQSFCPPGSGSAVRKVSVYVSDFGKKRMEIEARYGPQGIWKEQLQEDEEDENEDLYEYIADVDEEEEGEEEEEDVSEGEDNSESEGSESEGSEDSPAPPTKGGHKSSVQQKSSKKALKGADFVRRNGAVGLVMHDDLKTRGVRSKYKSGDSESESEGSEDSEDSEDSGGESDDNSADGVGKKDKKASKQKKLKDGEGFDEVALRKYELSKLRYYFAVAECDSARTANMLYEELDGVEMEASSMVFDLSLVPEELDFSDREVRDFHSASASGAVNPNYKPPDFVVNALQHTKVQCSWDEGEKLRDRKLSNFSTWRNLNESELQQYVADSASSDDDDGDNGDDNSEPELTAKASKKASRKKQNKSALMRKMLLGDDDSQADDSDVEEGKDDFFMQDGEKDSDDSGDDQDEDSGDGMYDSDGEVPAGFEGISDDEEEDGEGKTLTYMPELGKDLLAAKKRGGAAETPYEAEQRKMAEKKKARKAAKKAYQEQQEAEKKAIVQAAKKPMRKSKGKIAPDEELTAEERKRKAELELLFDDADPHAEDDYDMRELVLAEKDKARGKKSKRRKGTTDAAAAAGDDFKLDMQDSRFSKLFEGDSRFGIDKTSTEFKPTAASKDILSEQAKRRAQKERSNGGRPDEEQAPLARAAQEDGDDLKARPVDVDNLVNKLKRKYAKA